MHTVYSKYNDSSISYNHSCFYDLKWTGIEPQIHDGYELIYVKSGDLTYLIDGKSYRVKKSSLILTRPGKRHIVLFNSKREYDRYDIIADENALLGEIFSYIPDNIDVLKLGEHEEIGELFSKMDYYYKHFEEDAYKSLLIGIINEIICNIAIISKSPDAVIPKSGYSENPIITAAVEYIEANLRSELSLGELCRELYISKSYLHQLFKEQLKTSPQKYISAKRLILIQKEIRRGIKPTEAYLSYGFSDYSTFYRAFKKQFGYAPSEEAHHKVEREIIL